MRARACIVASCINMSAAARATLRASPACIITGGHETSNSAEEGKHRNPKLRKHKGKSDMRVVGGWGGWGVSASMARGRGAVIPGRGQRTCDCRDRVASGVYLLRFPAAVPPLKPALRSRSCRRPSDIECAAPFRLNCKKNVSVVFVFSPNLVFSVFSCRGKNLYFACVFCISP